MNKCKKINTKTNKQNENDSNKEPTKINQFVFKDFYHFIVPFRIN